MSDAISHYFFKKRQARAPATWPARLTARAAVTDPTPVCDHTRHSQAPPSPHHLRVFGRRDSRRDVDRLCVMVVPAREPASLGTSHEPPL